MFKAIRLYFATLERRYWFRKSTKEWVLEVSVEFRGEYSSAARYPHRFKVFTHIVWLQYFWGTVKDLKKILNKISK